MAGFLQIGQNGSGHVLTLLVVSQKADYRFHSYYTHLMSSKCAFRKRKCDGCGCPNFEVISSPIFVSFFGDTMYIYNGPTAATPRTGFDIDRMEENYK